jgi:hypothetical protein
MKRFIMLLGLVCVCLAASPAISAFAAENGGETKPPSNVTITVVMPESAATTAPEATSEPTPEPAGMYPVDVTETVDGAFRQIVKTYELNPDESPDDIPRTDFERSGFKYTLTDILRKESANMETRDHTETVTLNTDTKETPKILPLLSQTMEFKSEDGFVGVLTLDVPSVKVETAGTKTTSYTTSVTREYPRLSTNDTELVPKTVTDKGKTYYLAGVEWKVGNYSTVDYERIADYYTAVATYTATGSSTKVTGYITTAEYKGTLAKLAQGRPVYTAHFIGEEIRTPLEMTESPKRIEPTPTPTHETAASTEVTATPEPTGTPETTGDTAAPEESAPYENDGESKEMNVLYAVLPILGAAVGIAFSHFKKKKGAANQ